MMKDGYSKKISESLNEWLNKIKKFQSDATELVKNIPALSEYVSNYHHFKPIGLSLRRFMCEKYGEVCTDGKGAFVYKLSDGREIYTGDHTLESYDIEHEDIAEYVDILLDVVKRYNKDSESVFISNAAKQEFRRLLRSTTSCNRQKAFFLSFALHLDESEVTVLLNETLAEPTYSFRDPYEIIALFCQSHREFNLYSKYLELCQKYEELKADAAETGELKINYTLSVKESFDKDIHTEAELLEFLKENIPNFTGRSETAYKQWLLLYRSISEDLLGNEFPEFNYEDSAEECRKKFAAAIKAGKLVTPETLAKKILYYVIPRDSFDKTTRQGQSIVVNDFVKVKTGSDNPDRTTLMPKQVMENLPYSDRILDLLSMKKPIERKDLIMFKFFRLALLLDDNDYVYDPEVHSMNFLMECNSMLAACDMSGLYPGNRFDALVILTILTQDPYMRFSDIIYESFLI